MSETLKVNLLGYPEALLAIDTVTVALPLAVTADSLATRIANMSPQLVDALLHEDGTPRQTTKVLINGRPVMNEAAVTANDEVAVLASLPCDG